ncbi:MAG TPA: class I SAM-dependent methyltransferase [Burkholderiales bacterium]|nr:class I SAM-dependent methyltransferase [Burkholderiales bacterium]
MSAPLARRLAPQLCREDPATGETCAWCHGIWQYLRLMGLAAAPEHHAEFYRRAFRSVAGGKGAPRVLVSGAADYSMLAHVLASFRERGVEPDVTVVDACETPIFLNRWYAEREAASVACSRADILEYACATPFDAVCTHSFLVQFSPEKRIRLLERWRQLLRPGGVVITVTRVRPMAGAERARFSPEQAQSFRATVLRQGKAMRVLLQVDPDELAREAELYISGQRPWPVGSRDEVRHSFEASGFSINELSDTPPAAPSAQRLDGPAVAGSGERVQIIATRL